MATVPSLLDAWAITTDALNPANYTVSAGSNRRLIVCIRYNDAADAITGVTYGTQAMTQLLEDNGSNARMYVYELDETGIAAAASTAIAVTYSPGNPGTTRHVMFVASFENCDQSALTTAFDDTDDSPAGVIDVDITGIADSLGVAFASGQHGNNTSQSWTWQNSWVEATDADSADVDVTATTATKALSAGTETAQATLNTDINTGQSQIFALRLDPADATSIGAIIHHRKMLGIQ